MFDFSTITFDHHSSCSICQKVKYNLVFCHIIYFKYMFSYFEKDKWSKLVSNKKTNHVKYLRIYGGSIL
jgi:hypothetical protein